MCRLSNVYPLIIHPCGERPLWFDVPPQLPSAWVKALTNAQLAAVVWARRRNNVGRIYTELYRRGVAVVRVYENRGGARAWVTDQRHSCCPWD